MKDADAYPMNCVNWDEADKFCTLHGKRLPTEVEWLHAAGPANFPWGNEAPASKKVCWAKGETCLVAQYEDDVTPAGIHDLAGNVQEWIQDEEGTTRRFRGGAWNSTNSQGLRADSRVSRQRLSPELRQTNLGFRCVKSASVPAKSSP
jgi:formylglycine-generating enzyme required for sulfatase activity